jgi:hypothetical protein
MSSTPAKSPSTGALVDVNTLQGTPTSSILKLPLEDIYDDDGTIDHVYQAKARLLNGAIQEIGMGRYQIALFFCAGFGWFA